MKEPKRNNYASAAKAILFVAFMVTIYAIAGTSDYHEAQRQKQRYCDMVERGAWPDFRNTYKEACTHE